MRSALTPSPTRWCRPCSHRRYGPLYFHTPLLTQKVRSPILPHPTAHTEGTVPYTSTPHCSHRRYRPLYFHTPLLTQKVPSPILPHPTAHTEGTVPYTSTPHCSHRRYGPLYFHAPTPPDQGQPGGAGHTKEGISLRLSSRVTTLPKTKGIDTRFVHQNGPTIVGLKNNLKCRKIPLPFCSDSSNKLCFILYFIHSEAKTFRNLSGSSQQVNQISAVLSIEVFYNLCSKLKRHILRIDKIVHVITVTKAVVVMIRTDYHRVLWILRLLCWVGGCSAFIRVLVFTGVT